MWYEGDRHIGKNHINVHIKTQNCLNPHFNVRIFFLLGAACLFFCGGKKFIIQEVGIVVHPQETKIL